LNVRFGLAPNPIRVRFMSIPGLACTDGDYDTGEDCCDPISTFSTSHDWLPIRQGW
jgi:hypothetical protein